MVKIECYSASELEPSEWLELQNLQREALADALVRGDNPRRTQEDIDTFVGWHEPERYVRSHQNPNSEVGVGGRFSAGQAFSLARIAIAKARNETVGFAYAANNVSGATEAIRDLKYASVIRRYLWLREIAVKSDYQHQGTARQLGRALLEPALHLQPVTTYAYPDETPRVFGQLTSLGFKPTGTKMMEVYGPDRGLVRQTRLQAPFAGRLLRTLEAIE